MTRDWRHAHQSVRKDLQTDVRGREAGLTIHYQVYILALQNMNLYAQSSVLGTHIFLSFQSGALFILSIFSSLAVYG